MTRTTILVGRVGPAFQTSEVHITSADLIPTESTMNTPKLTMYTTPAGRQLYTLADWDNVTEADIEHPDNTMHKVTNEHYVAVANWLNHFAVTLPGEVWFEVTDDGGGDYIKLRGDDTNKYAYMVDPTESDIESLFFHWQFFDESVDGGVTDSNGLTIDSDPEAVAKWILAQYGLV